MGMLEVAIVFLLLVIIVQLAFKHPTSGVDPVASWRDIQKTLSAKVAAIGGFLMTMIPVIDQLNEAVPEINAIQSLHELTSAHPYQLATGLLTFAGIVARRWRQGSLTLENKSTSENEKH